MKISNVIAYLQQYQRVHGDVVLYSEKDSGRESWVSPFIIKVVLQTNRTTQRELHMVQDEGY